MSTGHKFKSRIENYYQLFLTLMKDPRMKVRKMAKILGHTGRGRNFSTIAKRLKRMYGLGISLPPKMTLKTFENVYLTAYFCKQERRDNKRKIFFELKEDNQIDYILFLGGHFDFFIATRENSIDLRKYNLNVLEVQKLYKTMYSVPKGWNLSMEEAFEDFSSFNFKKGLLNRKVNGNLSWAEIDWRIFYAMRENVRSELTTIGEEVGVSSTTVKSHLYKYVLPQCSIAHYFFPKGYDYYKQAFVRVSSKYEYSIVQALSKLPCTTYVLPLEREIILNFFHNDVNLLMTTLQEIEEIGVIDTYSLEVPLTYSLKDSVKP